MAAFARGRPSCCAVYGCRTSGLLAGPPRRRAATGGARAGRLWWAAAWALHRRRQRVAQYTSHVNEMCFGHPSTMHICVLSWHLELKGLALRLVHSTNVPQRHAGSRSLQSTQWTSLRWSNDGFLRGFRSFSRATQRSISVSPCARPSPPRCRGMSRPTARLVRLLRGRHTDAVRRCRTLSGLSGTTPARVLGTACFLRARRKAELH
jgi:hypothetical protein